MTQSHVFADKHRARFHGLPSTAAPADIRLPDGETIHWRTGDITLAWALPCVDAG